MKLFFTLQYLRFFACNFGDTRLYLLKTSKTLFAGGDLILVSKPFVVVGRVAGIGGLDKVAVDFHDLETLGNIGRGAVGLAVFYDNLLFQHKAFGV